jgi:hypothetical protein
MSNIFNKSIQSEKSQNFKKSSRIVRLQIERLRESKRKAPYLTKPRKMMARVIFSGQSKNKAPTYISSASSISSTGYK